MINQIKKTETFKNFLYDINSFKILFKTGKKLPTQFREMVKATLDEASTKQVIDLSSYEFKKLKVDKNENTFYNYFKDFEDFQGISFEQKVFTATENLIKNLTKTDNFTAKLQRDFLNDFSEFLEVKYFNDQISVKTSIKEHDDTNTFVKSLNDSEKLKEVFVDSEMHGKIDFDTIKNSNVIYKSDSKHLEYKDTRVKSDLGILLILLREKKIILETTTQKYLANILNEVLQQDSDFTSLINGLNAKNSDSKKRTDDDDKAFKSISEFLDQFIS
ncbi:hypothetical protein A1704_15280 [Chryseobacterium cucumeris]|uniref:hypothetical protein n=1 Tax=Chryseobacterium cucumeris TaxID=1813611 RepID=UPI0007874339|nr:hypothetical protein [Chryseobacterium cucumeris]KYH04727.1 hypothetical protein A1704_15280 [Chryseobacterium cucumeris]